jgi:CheY-like chemotaxis protein
MPGGSGADLARGLKASGASVPIVIMTGDVGLDGKLYENVPALAILDKVSFVAMPSEIVASFFASAWPPRAAASPYPPLIARP